MKRTLHHLLNSTGSSMLQVMVAGAVLLGAGAYVTKTMKSQESLNKTTILRSATAKQVQEITEKLTDWEVCKATFAQSGALSDNKTFDRILNKDNNVIYQTGIETLSGKITEILLTKYIPGSGLKRNQSKLRFTMEFREKRGGGQDSFGGTRKSYEVPVYLITLDNIVQTCMSDSGEVISDALMKACSDFGGTYNAVTGSCENIYGPTGAIKKYISDYFCSATGTGCSHPYAGQVCPDTYGHGNFAVSDFDASGKMNCTCMPIACPKAENYCFNKDLGTDWCGKSCGNGSWTPTNWSPDASTVCHGQTFTQVTKCDSRQAVGTKFPSDWAPSTNTVCAGNNLTQTNSCGDTRVVSGTKTCP